MHLCMNDCIYVMLLKKDCHSGLMWFDLVFDFVEIDMYL